MIRVTVYDKQQKNQIMEAAQGETLMQLLGRYRIYFPGNCGGLGRCSRCQVLVDGQRKKACRYVIEHPCKVLLPFPFTSVLQSVTKHGQEDSVRKEEAEKPYTISVDLGTTTIGMALCDARGRILCKCGMENPQRSYGADVAARITYAKTEQGLHQLQSLVNEALLQGVEMLYRSIEEPFSGEEDWYIAGNPTMLHILAGLSPESIGSYPFEPMKKEAFTKEVAHLGTLHFLPCASGYIGADVIVGAYVSEVDRKEQMTLFVDLGTNGEMILSARGQLLAASVAAGPAFEQLLLGADALHILCSMRKQQIIDEEGTLMPPYFEEGYCCHTEAGETVVITQEDIRQLQLAKAAVMTGISLLCQRAGIAVSSIECVLLAGGFGFYLKEEDAIFLRMFPECFAGKIKLCGNTSLQGTIQCSKKPDALQAFAQKIQTVDLSNEEAFHEEFIKNINF